MHSTRIAFLVPLLLSLAVGCRAGGGGTTGTLVVTVGDAAGAPREVTITGPDGFAETISETTTFDDLAPGSYTLAAPRVRTGHAVVDAIFQPAIAGSPATVEVDGTANASVSYSQTPGTGLLWVASSNNGRVVGYAAGQLLASTDDDPAVVLQLGNNTYPSGLAVGPDGSLWVGLCNTEGAIGRLAPELLVASGTPDPSTVLDGAGGCWVDLVFDQSGTLWAADANGRIAGWPASALADGTPPTYELTLPYPDDVIFDSTGNLWFTAYSSGEVRKLTPTQLAAGGTPTADVTLEGFNGPAGLAFASDGSLWVADYSDSSVVHVPLAQLSASGEVVPDVVLSEVPSPEGIAFDNSGGLWVALYGDSLLGRLSPAQLATSAVISAPERAIDLTGTALDTPYDILFHAPPPGFFPGYVYGD